MGSNLAGGFGVFLSQVLAKNSVRRNFLGPIPLQGTRAKGLCCGICLSGMTLSVAGQGLPGSLHTSRPHLVVQSSLVVNVSEKPRVGIEGPLCTGERVQVLRPWLVVLARSLFLTLPQDSAGTWVSVSWLEKALSKRKVLYLGGGVPGT